MAEITTHPQTDQEYLEHWNEVQRFLGEDIDGLTLVSTGTMGAKAEIDIHYGLFIWIANIIMEQTCPKCKQFKPSDSFISRNNKCRDCAF